MIPIVYSVIPDFAPERHRVTANLCFAALMALGASAGYYFGDSIVQTANHLIPLPWEPWRKAMLLLSCAGVPLLALGSLTVDSPRRVVLADVQTAGSLSAFLRARWQAVGLFAGVAGSLMIAVQGLNPLIALALKRRFGADLGVIGHALGVVTLVTSAGCLPIAGVLDRLLLGRFGPTARPLIMGVCAIAAVPCAAALIAAGSVDEALISVALFLFATCTANALVPTMLQDLAPASLRARSFAIWSFVVSVFCALGPLVAGALSDFVFHGRLLAAIAVTAIPALLLSAACAARSMAVAGRG